MSFAARLLIVVGFGCAALAAGAAPEISFSPTGTTKQVRQVVARFSTAMVSFGDPRLAAPFDVQCAEPGRGRWVDSRAWAYDFERDLPAGIACRFTSKSGLQAQDNSAVPVQSFDFDTGGPAIVSALPWEGGPVDENQVFVLTLDAAPDLASVRRHAQCRAEGIGEAIPVTLIDGAARDKVLKAAGLLNEADQIRVGRDKIYIKKGRRQEQRPLDSIVTLQCRRRLPNGVAFKLDWGPGIRSLTGVATNTVQTLAYTVRPAFTATQGCERENARAGCVPILPMWLSFSAPVPWSTAAKITLNGPDNQRWPARRNKGEETTNLVNGIRFVGPFPEKSKLVINLPDNLRDDAGRALSNAGQFPLTVALEANPPLAKFPGDFGILEWHTGGILPVTVRNIEASMKAHGLRVGADDTLPGLAGRMKHLGADDAAIIEWLARDQLGYDKSALTQTQAKPFRLPKPGASQDFEVMGIPLKEPGFYVVELESPALGKRLLPERGPMYIRTKTLVTNLSVHFKKGRESSLVWVTSLDQAQPVSGAQVAIRSCDGRLLWEGKTDAQGLARVNESLGQHFCPNGLSGDFVSARLGRDLAFVVEGWSEGIEPWRFNLPQQWRPDNIIAHTVLDRSLFRAGETVHMKHLLRTRTGQGFGTLPDGQLPQAVLLTHQGTNERFIEPIAWRGGAAETTFKIPAGAKLGVYQVRLLRNLPKPPANARAPRDQQYVPPEDGWDSAQFRVEEYRLPTLRATLKGPTTPLVNARSLALDLGLAYLAGGPAGNEAVQIRGKLEPRELAYIDYPGFVFANGDVELGRWRNGAAPQVFGPIEHSLAAQQLTLDRLGQARVNLPGLPPLAVPQSLLVEMEYRDPNGETVTSAQRLPLWTAKVVAGIKRDEWITRQEKMRVQVLVLDLTGKPAVGAPVNVDLLRRQEFSHRKRLLGGFYAYETTIETRKVGSACTGKSDDRGLLTCEITPPMEGNLILRARAQDSDGQASIAHQDIWVGGEEWGSSGNHDRIDVLPEKPRLEPNETARLQVRMPFRQATALVTVEREGVLDARVMPLSGRNPVVEVPLAGHYAPNVFVSVLALRGRIDGAAPTAMVDLAKPAFRLGYAQLRVGWTAHELKVEVTPAKPVYQVRDKVAVRVKVRRADGQPLPVGAEVAFAAVDEALLELAANPTWKLLEGMMGQRPQEVTTHTAQLQVIGKRHFGKKALPPGGDGGLKTERVTREQFDPLLKWQARVALNSEGEATLEVPLNDALSSFRLVAVAQAGVGLFGHGQTAVRTSQDLMLLAGLPPLVREGDRFRAMVTLRNTTSQPLPVALTAVLKDDKGRGLPALAPQAVTLESGEARELAWDVTVPTAIGGLAWDIAANAGDGTGPVLDRMKVQQKVVEAVPVAVYQATIQQLDGSWDVPVAAPRDSLPGKGGLRIDLAPRLADGIDGLRDFMRRYEFTCFEQQASRAIVLGDSGRWQDLMVALPVYLDSDGLLKYFPLMTQGSDTLTAYVLSIAAEAGWTIPEESRNRMLNGLTGFVEGRILRASAMPTADVAIRKMAAVEAIVRQRKIAPKLLDSIAVEPQLWPTSAVLDWISVLQRTPELPQRDAKLKEADNLVRARLNYQGTIMTFSTEKADYLWWLMISGDSNANRALLTFLDTPGWRDDMPRLMRGALARQRNGHWSTTIANAWGALMLQKFSQKFESQPVTGIASASLPGHDKSLAWDKHPHGGDLDLPFPKMPDTLKLRQSGSGKPWAIVQSRAAIPLTQPLFTGYTVKKTITPVSQKQPGVWQRGDVARIKLDLEAQSDMTWVAVRDPIPAGATILGSGLGGDSALLASGERAAGWTWPAYTERAQDAYRSYYRYVPKGVWSLEYTVRLNNPGQFVLPQTRVEAMYAPEMFGELPNAVWVVRD